jgi:hypothetical protein
MLSAISYRRSVFLAVAVALSATCHVFADVPFVTAVTEFGAVQNNGNYGVGLLFVNQTGQPVVITQLGRWVISGNSQTHTVGIYTGSSGGTPAASVTVNCSGATPGQFLYATLGTPYTVPIGGAVYILSTETNGGDLWYNNTNTVITITTLSYAPYGEQSAYFDGSSFHLIGNNGGMYTSTGPVSFQYSSPLPSWTKSGNTYTTNGSQFSVYDAMNNASAGDVVLIPAGTYTWGAGGMVTNINKVGVTLSGVAATSPGMGAGAPSTIINMSTSAPSGYGPTLFSINAAATVSNLEIVSPNANNANNAVFGVTTAGWRITNVTYDGTCGGLYTGIGSNGTNIGNVGYFVYQGNSANNFGVIDHCSITGGNGQCEMIFMRGDASAWQTPDSLGSANAYYVENCDFNGSCYVSDFNSNSREVVRFNTINGNIKIDAHGMATNSPPRSSRHFEVYCNTFTSPGLQLGTELRGGTGMVFGNSAISGGLILDDYSAFTGPYPTTASYAIPDQIGSGEDRSGTVGVSVSVGNPATITLGSGNFGANPVGSNIYQQTITANSSPALSGQYNLTITGSNTATIAVNVTASGTGTLTWGIYSGGGASDPVYCWNNTQNGSALPMAASEWGTSMAGFINPNRDYFDAATSVNGVVGVTVGSFANMPATGAAVGVGYWATDKGNWNTQSATNQAGQGELFVWNGSAWVIKYVPYTYPYAGVPVTPSNLSISSP